MQNNRNLSEKERYEQRKKMHERRRQIQRARKIFFIGSFIAILILAGLITLLINLIFGESGDNTNAVTSAGVSDTAESTGAEQNTPSTGENSAANEQQANSGENTGDTANGEGDTSADNSQAQEDVQNETAQAAVSGVLAPYNSSEITYTVPNAEIMSCAANGRVTADYFANVTFIGDSLLQNLKLKFSGTYSAHYLAYYNVEPADLLSGNVTTMGGPAVVALDDITANERKNIYIQLGADALNSASDEEFLQGYEELLTTLKETLSEGTIFYIQAIAPVSYEKSQQSDSFSNERIRSLNDALALIAYEHDVNFLNIYTALANENGDLRTDYSSGSGGIQLNEQGSTAWLEYIITHTAYESGGPYEAGAPYIVA